MNDYNNLVLVILLLFFILFPIIAYLIVIRTREKNFELVKNNSKALKEVFQLSQKYKFYSILETYVRKVEQKNLRAFRSFNYDEYFLAELKNNFDNYQKLIIAVEQNSKNYNDYLVEYNEICKTRITEWPSIKCREIEQKLLEEAKVTVVCSIRVCIKNYYRTPKGRNTYEDVRFFSQKQITDALDELHSNGATVSKEIETLRTLRELCNKFNTIKLGCPVTTRIKQVTQPRGGYINPKNLTTTTLGEGMEALNPTENVHASLVGTAVDYMTRYMLGKRVEDAFHISMLGAMIIREEKKAKELMSEIKGLDHASVVNAVKLSGFDVCYRSSRAEYKSIDEIMPDAATVENIITMVNRALNFFSIYGPKVLDGFTFEGGYTDVVGKGDGDFTTQDTLWDFKVSRGALNKDHTLQLLMYWRMGLHSIHPEFKDIQYLGIYNPRQNTVSRIAVLDIPESVIKEVDTTVIGYKE